VLLLVYRGKQSYQQDEISHPDVVEQVCDLFQDNCRLALGFNAFLPEKYHVKLTSAGTLDVPARQGLQSGGSDYINEMHADEDT
jgi:histone deacetylase complex regulatory component SIN3